MSDTLRMRWAGVGCVEFDAPLDPAGMAAALEDSLVRYRWSGARAGCWSHRRPFVWFREYCRAELHMWHRDRWHHFTHPATVTGVPYRLVRDESGDPRWRSSAGRCGDPAHPLWRELLREDLPEDAEWCQLNAVRIVRLVEDTWAAPDRLDSFLLGFEKMLERLI